MNSFQTISVHLPKNDDQLKGFINNQQQDWSFPLDKVDHIATSMTASSQYITLISIQFLHNASQEVVYSECASEMTSKVLDGFNGTILAYGQTGAGKTYTMTGGHSQSYRQRGIVPRAISQVFSEVRERLDSTISVQ